MFLETARKIPAFDNSDSLCWRSTFHCERDRKNRVHGQSPTWRQIEIPWKLLQSDAFLPRMGWERWWRWICNYSFFRGTSMTSFSIERPAILGGAPVRPAGPPTWPRNDPLVHSALMNLIDSGDWGRYHGPHVPELTRRLSEYFGIAHVIPCGSGTAAVELALRGVGVMPDDEVILAGYDFKANFQNILCLRAVPILVDLDPTTWQLNPERLSAAISNRTRSILISHLHGGFVDVRQVQEIAKAHGLTVVEDICQNPGATLFGRLAGKWGDVSVLSFGGSKLLTAGRGGAVLTDRPEIAERIKRYTHRGNEAYPLSEMQAAIVRPQIDELDKFNTKRRETVQTLSFRLANMEGLSALQLPSDELLPAYYKVGFRYRAECFDGLSRSLLIDSLRAEGIPFDAGFRGLHLVHSNRRFRAADELIEATQADSKMLTLHHPILLEGEIAVNQICDAITKIKTYASEIRSKFAAADPSN